MDLQYLYVSQNQGSLAVMRPRLIIADCINSLNCVNLNTYFSQLNLSQMACLFMDFTLLVTVVRFVVIFRLHFCYYKAAIVSSAFN